MKIPKQNCYLKQVIDFYLHSPAFGRLKAGTQIKYEIYLMDVAKTKVFGKKLGNYRLNDIKVMHLTMAYEQWLRVGVRTANYRKSVLSVAWRTAMRYDVMTHNPVALVKTEGSGPARTVWTREQVKEFLNTAYGDFRWRSIGLIVHMAYEWGQRVGDMRVLTWDKLDLSTGRLNLTQSKRNAEVHLPITEGLCSMLRQQKEEFEWTGWVAPRVRPRAGAYTPYDPEEVAPLINQVLAEAELPMHLNAMDLRRTAVTEMMEGDVDLIGIMQVTGHKNVASLKHYMVNTFSGASKALAARGNEEDDS